MFNFQKGDEVTHHKGGLYVVLGLANQNSSRAGFPTMVVYHRKGKDPLNDANWYSRPLEEFQEKFTLTELLEKFEVADDGTIEVTLSVFNTPNRFGDTYVLDVDSINKFMSGRIGKDIGEMQFPNPAPYDVLEHFRIINTVDSSKSAGLLVDYYLRVGATKNDQTPIMVVGRIDPSPALLERMKNRVRPSFGIRSITHPARLQEVGKPKVVAIASLVAFDIVKENPRLVSPDTGSARR